MTIYDIDIDILCFGGILEGQVRFQHVKGVGNVRTLIEWYSISMYIYILFTFIYYIYKSLIQSNSIQNGLEYGLSWKVPNFGDIVIGFGWLWSYGYHRRASGRVHI